MEDEAELFKDCETDSTSRNSSKESISSASSQIASEVTTKILDRAAGNVSELMAEISTEVLRLFMETIIEMISIAIKQFAPPNGNLSTGSLTLSQGCGKEMAGKKLPSELFREKFDIPEDKLQLSLNGSFGKAFWDVVGEDTSISTTPTFNEAIVRKITDKVNSVLSDTIKASLNGNSSKVHGARCRQFINCRACREMSTGVIQTLKSVIIGLGTPRKKAIQTVKTQKQIDQESKGDRSTGAHTIDVHQKRTKWWSCPHKWRKTEIQPDSVKLRDEAVGLTSGEFPSGQTHSSSPPATSSISSVHSISLNSGTLELNHNEEDEDTTLGKPLNTPSSHSICSSPSACHNVMVPDYCEGPSLSKPLAKVRSSSFHQSGDSGKGNIQSVAGTDEVVMSASDTDKSCRLFCCKGKKKEDKMASAQDRAVRTKRLSLFKRILLCCCHLEDDET